MKIFRKYFYFARILMRFLSNFLSGLLVMKVVLLFFYVVGGINNFTDSSMELILRCSIFVDSLIFLSSLFTIIRIFRLTHRLPIKVFKFIFILMGFLLSPVFVLIENIMLVFLAE